MGTVIDSHFLGLTAIVTVTSRTLFNSALSVFLNFIDLGCLLLLCLKVGYQLLFFIITALLKIDKVTDFAGIFHYFSAYAFLIRDFFFFRFFSPVNSTVWLVGIIYNIIPTCLTRWTNSLYVVIKKQGKYNFKEKKLQSKGSTFKALPLIRNC